MLFLTHCFCRTAVFLAVYFTTGCQLHAAEARTKLHSIAEEEYEAERPLTFLQQLRTELQAESKTLEAAGNTARAGEKSDLIQDVIQMLVKIAANSGGLNLDEQEANSEALTTLLERVAKDRLTDHHQAVCALALAGKKLDAANEYLA
ncbi:hypothetical protein EBZ39_14860 [bacterium]|nr:hypothetical protein [bacterium]